jgi:hypothetical protein
MFAMTDFEDETRIPFVEQRLRELRTERDNLRSRLGQKIGRKHFDDARVLWKTVVLYQCVIRRTLELTDGIERAWANREYLISVVLARVLIETTAFIWDTTVQLNNHVQAGNLDAADTLITQRALGSKMHEWVAGGTPEATQVLTLIDRMDRSMHRIAGRTGPVQASLRDHYDILSEFAHPNFLGIQNLYGTLDEKHMIYKFGKITQEIHDRLSRTLAISLLAVPHIELCLRKLDVMAEPLRELHRQR